MVAGRPFYHAYPADFLMATQGWDLELKGAYRLLIDLLNDRDRPFPDDPKFIAGVLGCSIQKWRKLREILLDEGKLFHTEDGMHLTNPRFEREHIARTEGRAAAQMNGHLGGLQRARNAGQIDMDLDHKTQAAPKPRTRDAPARARTDSTKTSNKVATKLQQSSNFVASDSDVSEQKPSEINGRDQGGSSVRARAIVQSPEKDSSQPISDSDSPGRLANADLKQLYDFVCEAAGFCPTQPSAIDRAMTQVERWREAGVDFEKVVLPSIHAVVLASPEPTRTLGRFNARVMHEHARFKATPAAKEYEPPPIPKLNPEGEDPRFLALRTDLLETLGDRTYCLYFNRTKFEAVNDALADKQPIKVSGNDYLTEHIRHGRFRNILLAAAKPYGFNDVW